jgi:hypothetical protein
LRLFKSMTKATTTVEGKAVRKVKETAEQKEQKALLKQWNKERLSVLKGELHDAIKVFKWVHKDYVKMERESNERVAKEIFENLLTKYNEDVLLKRKAVEDFKNSCR